MVDRKVVPFDELKLMHLFLLHPVYCIITKNSLEDTRTAKRGKSEKWNHFFERDLNRN
jgi:hypothetical protein